ncbi:MAG TPA: VIT domain-containing protein, partial [Kofleriaceae bacterium]|nr:VIT domain-containing protein [Kofleriaceae bacterium]
MPFIGATLRGTARGGIARLVLEQRFENRYDETLHVTYRMPLPVDGAVSGYAFAVGDRKIVGKIDRKKAARERFERAIVEGHTAGLLEQERADIFTQKLGNIGARETIVATITIDQRLVWLPEGEWELRFPTVIGPRYISASDGPEVAAAVAIEVASKSSAAISIEFAIHDELTGKVASPTHTIAAAATAAVRGPSSSEVRVVLRDAARLDRDIVVRWPVARAEVGVSLAHARTTGELAYGLLTAVPPSASAGHAAVPRDLIVLLDTSGSMDGVPLDLAKKVVAMVIDSLDDNDRLELIEFSSSPRRYNHKPLAATARAKRDAIDWVHQRTASGGTEMMAAVIEAMSSLRAGSQRQVVIVTDGYIGGEQQLVSLLGDKLPPSCRLHVLGVGAAVNRSLATALSRAGRGTEVIVGPGEDPERGAKRLVDRTRRPVLTNLTIEGNAVIDHVPAYLPDVFEGSPLVAAVALSAQGGTVTVRGDLAHGRWEKTIKVPALPTPSGDPAIVALYARERVADFEARWNESLDDEIEKTGLAYQIATRMTSWIAVDESR